MVKGKMASSKCLLFVVTQIKQINTSNRTVGTLVLLKLAFTNSIQLYKFLMISLAIAVHDVFVQLRNVCV